MLGVLWFAGVLLVHVAVFWVSYSDSRGCHSHRLCTNTCQDSWPPILTPWPILVKVGVAYKHFAATPTKWSHSLLTVDLWPYLDRPARRRLDFLTLTPWPIYISHAWPLSWVFVQSIYGSDTPLWLVHVYVIERLCHVTSLLSNRKLSSWSTPFLVCHIFCQWLILRVHGGRAPPPI